MDAHAVTIVRECEQAYREAVAAFLAADIGWRAYLIRLENQVLSGGPDAGDPPLVDPLPFADEVEDRWSDWVDAASLVEHPLVRRPVRLAGDPAVQVG